MEKLAVLMTVAAAIASAQESGRVAVEGVPDDAILVHVYGRTDVSGRFGPSSCLRSHRAP